MVPGEPVPILGVLPVFPVWLGPRNTFSSACECQLEKLSFSPEKVHVLFRDATPGPVAGAPAASLRRADHRRSSPRYRAREIPPPKTYAGPPQTMIQFLGEGGFPRFLFPPPLFSLALAYATNVLKSKSARLRALASAVMEVSLVMACWHSLRPAVTPKKMRPLMRPFSNTILR